MKEERKVTKKTAPPGSILEFVTDEGGGFTHEAGERVRVIGWMVEVESLDGSDSALYYSHRFVLVDDTAPEEGTDPGVDCRCSIKDLLSTGHNQTCEWRKTDES